MSERRLRVGQPIAPEQFDELSDEQLARLVPRAAVSTLNEIVEGGASKEGDIVFAVPWAVQTLALRIHHYAETADLPLAVSGTRASEPPTLPTGPRRVTLDGPAELGLLVEALGVLRSVAAEHVEHRGELPLDDRHALGVVDPQCLARARPDAVEHRDRLVQVEVERPGPEDVAP